MQVVIEQKLLETFDGVEDKIFVEREIDGFQKGIHEPFSIKR